MIQLVAMFVISLSILLIALKFVMKDTRQYCLSVSCKRVHVWLVQADHSNSSKNQWKTWNTNSYKFEPHMFIRGLFRKRHNQPEGRPTFGAQHANREHHANRENTCMPPPSYRPDTPIPAEFWDEEYGAEGDDEAYDCDTDEWHISDQDAGTAHDSMQVPTSATGHEEEAQAAATGHEEAQATATGQEKKSAATGDHEQALAEAPSSDTSQRRRDDKPLLASRPTCFTVDSHCPASRLTYFIGIPQSQVSTPTLP